MEILILCLDYDRRLYDLEPCEHCNGSNVEQVSAAVYEKIMNRPAGGATLKTPKKPKPNPQQQQEQTQKILLALLICSVATEASA